MMKRNLESFMNIKRNLIRFCLLCAVLLALPSVVQAQFTYTTNGDGSLNVSQYTGSGGAVTIPATVTGLPVTTIGFDAFFNTTSLTSITFGTNVTDIGSYAFFDCVNLTNIVVPSSVTNIESYAFYYCPSLLGVYFRGNAPSNNATVFTSDANAIAYYLAGTTGWQATFDGIPTATYLPYTYTINGGAVTITGYIGSGGAVTVPSTLNGLPVTSIGNDAFYQCASLTSVIIPSGVTNIGVGAFFSCTSLTSVTIPNTVTSIGKFAFENCLSLTSITIPASVTSIATVAFAGCTSLTSVIFQGNAPAADSSIFDNDNNVTVYYPPGATGWGSMFGGFPTSNGSPQTTFPYTYTTNNGAIIITGYIGSGGAVTIPGTISGLPVTVIGYEAFYTNQSVTNVTIPDSVTNIGAAAFAGGVNLTSVTMGTNLVSIGAQAFQVTRLASVTIPNNVTIIGDEAFNFCESLTNVTIGTNVITIGTNVFYECLNLPGITIPNSVTSIGDQSFENCNALTNITLSTNLTSIGNGEFGSSALISVAIPNSVTNIGNQAFSYCASLTNVLIGTNVASIGTNAFYQCLGLTSLTIPNSITNINAYAFYGCTNLASVTMGTNVSFVGFAFANCFALTGVNFIGNAPVPANNTNVFSGDTNGIAYYLPGTTGWPATFDGLPTILIVPYTYTTNNGTITITAYTGSSGSVTIPGSINGLPVTTIGTNTFANDTSLTNVTIPAGITTIGTNAFSGCLGLTSVTIPNSVTNIGYGAFANCTNLLAINLNSGNTAYATVAGVLFNLNQTMLVEYPDGKTGTSYSIPVGITNIANYAFAGAGLSGIYFQGNSPAPTNDATVFSGDISATVYYLPGTTGWGATFDGIPAMLYLPYTYTTNNGAITLTGYIGSGGAVVIPNTINGLSVTTITGAFLNVTNLTSITIGTNISTIQQFAFAGCTSLTNVYFLGNAPGADLTVFSGDNYATAYYLPGTTGWASTFDGIPAVLLNPPTPHVPTTDGSFGVKTNLFGFDITGTNNQTIVVEATTNLAGHVWIPIQTNIISGSAVYFSDPQWTNYHTRFYRVRSP